MNYSWLSDVNVQMKGGHTTHKLVFYAAHNTSTPTIILRGLVEEVNTRTDIYRAEADDKAITVEVKRVGMVNNES